MDQGREERYERDRERERRWGVTIVNYLVSVATFLTFIAIVLGGYWLWEDFAAQRNAGQPAPAFTWSQVKESLSTHFRQFIGEIRNPCPIAEAGTCENQ